MPYRCEALATGRASGGSSGAHSFRPRGLTIPVGGVLRVMGYRPHRPARAQLQDMTQAMAELAATAASPEASWRQVEITGIHAGGMTVSTGARFRGRQFETHWRDCREAVFFVLSLGARFDATQRNLSESGRSLEAYVMEVCGWLAVEELTRMLREHLGSALRAEGLALSQRLAPGYSYRIDGRKTEWPVEDQRELFSLFAGAAAPARLIEGSCTMTPKMSRTGAYGLHRNPLTTGRNSAATVRNDAGDSGETRQ